MNKSGFTITKRDRAIAIYISENNLCKRIMDDTIWIEIANILSLGENWKELKHRFLKYVVPYLKKSPKNGRLSNELVNAFANQLCNQSKITRSLTQKNNQASMSSVCFDSCYESHNPVSPESDNDTNASLNVQVRSSRNSERSKSTFNNNNNFESKTHYNLRTNTKTLIKRTELTTSDNKIHISNRKAHSTLTSEVSKQNARSPSQLNHRRNKVLIDKRETTEKDLTNATEEQKIHMWPCCNCLELNELCPGDRNHIFKRRCINCKTKQIIEIGRGVVVRVELFSNIPTEKDPVDTIETVRQMLLPDVSHYEYFF